MDDAAERRAPEVEAALARLADLGASLEWFGGNCPVQAEGSLLGEDLFFRARGSHWSVWIGPGARALRDSTLVERRAYAPPGLSEEDLRFAAGWMEEREALDLLADAIERHLLLAL